MDNYYWQCLEVSVVFVIAVKMVRGGGYTAFVLTKFFFNCLIPGNLMDTMFRVGDIRSKTKADVEWSFYNESSDFLLID